MENLINKKIERKIISLLRQHGIKKASIFGSFVRHAAKKSSDIDILIKFKGSKSLFDFIGLKLDLEKVFKRKVDLVEYTAIHPLIKNKVLKEQVRIV